jgi:hypothetical protein
MRLSIQAAIPLGLALALAACGAPDSTGPAPTAAPPAVATAAATAGGAVTPVQDPPSNTTAPCPDQIVVGTPRGPLGPGRFGTPERAALDDNPPECRGTPEATPSASTGAGEASSEGPASMGPVEVGTVEAQLGAIGPANPDDLGVTPTPLVGPRTIAIQDNQQTLELAVGDRFEVQLGNPIIWTVAVGDEQVIARTSNAVDANSQGIYQALAPGETMLTAQGEAPCRRSQPACMLPDMLFQLKVVVR